jgi:hypothetical protein
VAGQNAGDHGDQDSNQADANQNQPNRIEVSLIHNNTPTSMQFEEKQG